MALAKAGEFDMIVHGCNCFVTMGSGIARQIADQFPQALAADKTTTISSYDKLGTYTMSSAEYNNGVINTSKLFTIVNAYTQYAFNRGRDKVDLFEYTSFAMILQKLAHHYGHLRFGFPMIGMGLAGGNEVKIMSILSDFDEMVTVRGGSVTLVEFKI